MTTSIESHATQKGFERSLKQFFFEVPEQEVVKLRKQIAYDFVENIVNLTPADEGYAKAGWVVSNGAPSDEVPSTPDPTGDSTISKGKAVAARARGFGVTWITSSVPYILVLDQGGFVPMDPGPSKKGGHDGSRKGQVLVAGGYSLQAPHGMVDVSIHRALFMGG